MLAYRDAAALLLTSGCRLSRPASVSEQHSSLSLSLYPASPKHPSRLSVSKKTRTTLNLPHFHLGRRFAHSRAPLHTVVNET